MAYRTQAEGIRALNRSYCIRGLVFGAISVAMTSAGLYMVGKSVFSLSEPLGVGLLLFSAPIVLQTILASFLGGTTLNLLWHSISLVSLYQSDARPLEPGMQTFFYGFLAAAPILHFIPPITFITIPATIGLAMHDSIFSYKDSRYIRQIQDQREPSLDVTSSELDESTSDRCSTEGSHTRRVSESRSHSPEQDLQAA